MRTPKKSLFFSSSSMFLVLGLLTPLLFFLLVLNNQGFSAPNSRERRVDSLDFRPLCVSSSKLESQSNHTITFSSGSSASSASSASCEVLVEVATNNYTILNGSASPSSSIDGTIFINGSSSHLLGRVKSTILKHNESDDRNTSSRLVKSYSKLERLEASLIKVRAAIREAALVRNMTSVHQDPDFAPYGPLYRNANAFHRSYLEMEKLFKVYVYKEGELPLFHGGPCRSIYSTEGRFIHEMERGKFYRTTNPDEALVYFLPFSVVRMVHYLYKPESHDTKSIGRVVKDYINVISRHHPFWNRSLGADHFMLSCHDWGPRTSAFVPNLFQRSIRVLCNANTSEGFNPSKDASLPEINLLTGEITRFVGGPSPSHRPILAFFAGRLHGYIRYLLLKQWRNKDADVQVYDQLPKGVSYYAMLRKSKFCLCPSGYEVASPRIVEAIYTGCVPVLISDGYVPPFSDVLNWKAFSVEIQVKDIPNIKNVLMRISTRQYLRLQRRVKQVQRHFLANGTPKRFDVFHMTIHSIWLRRLNIQI